MSDSNPIVIIDDDHSVRKSLQGLIRSAGFAVKIFASAEEYLRSPVSDKTEILVIDVRMPGMSGLELQRRLLEIHCDIPIIFMTAHDDETARLQALKRGAIDYLFKPFGENVLMNAIYAALIIRLGKSFV
ncbi:MAG: response regulator [Acidobacteria bacterium]|nr:response regulator [Acidobacteriota bacterium]